MKLVSRESLYRIIIIVPAFIIIIFVFILMTANSKLNATYSQWFYKDIQINGKNIHISATQTEPWFSGDTIAF